MSKGYSQIGRGEWTVGEGNEGRPQADVYDLLRTLNSVALAASTGTTKERICESENYNSSLHYD